MIRINLLPVREERKKEKARQVISIGVLSIIFVLIAITFIHIRVAGQINSLKNQISGTDKEIKRLTKEVGDIKKYEKKKKDLQKKIDVIEMLTVKKTGPVRMLDELTKTVPSKLWISKMEERDFNLSLEGIALDNETIASFMGNLERSSSFTNVELIQSRQHVQDGLKLEKFGITCRAVLQNKK